MIWHKDSPFEIVTGWCLGVTCDLGDPLQPGDREGHSHPQVGPHQQQAVTDQQAAHWHSLVPYRRKQTHNMAFIFPKWNPVTFEIIRVKWFLAETCSRVYGVRCEPHTDAPCTLLSPGKSEKCIFNGPLQLEYSVVCRREGGDRSFLASGGIFAAMMFSGYLSPGQRRGEESG